MNTNFIALLLSLIAGLSTLIGSFVILAKPNKNILFCSLSFAAGVMLTVSFFDLLIESVKYILNYYPLFPSIIITGIFFIIGIILSSFIDKKIDNKNELYKLGIISLIAIIMHNIPEGMATFIASDTNIKIGITLTIAIALHNIPEGISIALPIYYSTNNYKRAFIYTLIAGLSEFIGALFTCLFLKPYITNKFMGYLLAIIAGIMTQISIYELIPNALKLKKYGRVGMSFLIGCLIMFITIYVL